MKRIGREISAAQYWTQAGGEYHQAITNAYHTHGLAVIRSLIGSHPDGTVLDFGCGDEAMLRFSYCYRN